MLSYICAPYTESNERWNCVYASVLFCKSSKVILDLLSVNMIVNECNITIARGTTMSLYPKNAFYICFPLDRYNTHKLRSHISLFFTLHSSFTQIHTQIFHGKFWITTARLQFFLSLFGVTLSVPALKFACGLFRNILDEVL